MDLSKISLSDWASIATIIASSIALLGFISGIVALIYRFAHRRRTKDDDRDQTGGRNTPDVYLIVVVLTFVVVAAIGVLTSPVVGPITLPASIEPHAAVLSGVATALLALILIAMVVYLVFSVFSRRNRRRARRPLKF